MSPSIPVTIRVRGAAATADAHFHFSDPFTGITATRSRINNFGNCPFGRRTSMIPNRCAFMVSIAGRNTSLGPIRCNVS